MGFTANYNPTEWFSNRLTLGLDRDDRKNREFYTIDTTGRWDPARGQLQLRYDQVAALGLEDRIVREFGKRLKEHLPVGCKHLDVDAGGSRRL